MKQKNQKAGVAGCGNEASCSVCGWVTKLPLILFLLACLAFGWLVLKGGSEKKQGAAGHGKSHGAHEGKSEMADHGASGEMTPKATPAAVMAPAEDAAEAAASASIAKLGALVDMNSSTTADVFHMPKAGMEMAFAQSLLPENATDRPDEKWYVFDRYLFSGERLLAKKDAEHQVANVAKMFELYPWLRGTLTGFYREDTAAAKAMAEKHVAQLAGDFANHGVTMETQTALRTEEIGLGDSDLAFRYTREAPKQPTEVKQATPEEEPQPVAPAMPAPAAESGKSTAEVVLPSGEKLSAAAGGFEARLVGALKEEKGEMPWIEFDGVNFETASARLTSDSTSQLQRAIAILKAYPTVHLKVGGYTDNTGNAKANVKLSGERAAAVKAYLVKNGVEAARLESEGYGQEHPVASNDTAEGRAKNRRVAVKVTQR